MRRNVIVAIAVGVLIIGLVLGVYLSRKSYIPVLSELRSEIENKNTEIRKLREKKEVVVLPVMYVINSGKVYPAGSSSAVLQEVMLPNGARLTATGILIRNNGTTMRLLSGDMISTDGTIKLSTESAN